MLTPTEQKAVDDITSLLANDPVQVTIGYHGSNTVHIYSYGARRPLTFVMSDRVKGKLLEWISNFFNTQIDAGRVVPDSGAAHEVAKVE